MDRVMTRCYKCDVVTNNIGMTLEGLKYCMNCSHDELSKKARLFELQFVKYKINKSASYKAIMVSVAKINDDRIKKIHINTYSKSICIIHDSCHYECVAKYDNRSDLIHWLNLITGAKYSPITTTAVSDSRVIPTI